MTHRLSHPILILAGTRPEGIKMAPLYLELKNRGLPVIFCATSQHTHMLAQVLELFGIEPDIDLQIMQPNQDLFHVATQVMLACKELFNKIDPSYVLVQGDTTSAMAAAQAAFYLHIPIGHIEAGLRTSTINMPFPEEFNRRVISMISHLHFTPTSLATANLLSEGISRTTIFQTGNTIVDALHLMRQKIIDQEIKIDEHLIDVISHAKFKNQKVLLLTVHRREAIHSQQIKDILLGIKDVALQNPDLMIIYPTHPNPMVQQCINEQKLHEVQNIFMTDALPYKDLVYILLHCDGVATDSGGVSEEAISLGKKVFILRSETERIEGVWAGIAELIGTRYSVLVQRLAEFTKMKSKMSEQTAIFGEGVASQRIADILSEYSRQQSLKNDARELSI